MKHSALLLAAASSLSLVACTPEKNYDPAMLAEYKRAIPTLGTMSAPSAQAATSSSFAPAPGDPALYPTQVGPIAAGINEVIGAILDGIEAVVQLEPTVYDSDTKEFLWGPYDDQGSAMSGDTVALYIRDTGESADDFRYQYALLRGIGNDVATMVPVIWGGGTPDASNEDYGSGVILFDAEANYAFEEANNPGHGPLDRGRFVSLFARGEDPSGVVTIVVSAFRNFAGAGDAQGMSVDHFYGALEGLDGNRLDFVDFEFTMDIDGAPSALENVGVHMALVNGGVGRAEVDAANGDVAAGTHIEGAECWGASIDRTYLYFESVDDSTLARTEIMPAEGAAGDCAIPTLAGVPSLDDLDPALRAALDAAASGGPQS